MKRSYKELELAAQLGIAVHNSTLIVLNCLVGNSCSQLSVIESHGTLMAQAGRAPYNSHAFLFACRPFPGFSDSQWNV